MTTAGSSGFINGAFYEQVPDQSTGTGVIKSFVRIQANGDEEGYNTDGRPVEFDENNSPQFTRSLLLSDVPVVNLLGIDYLQFLLDINQVNSGDNHFLSLNEIQLFQASSGDITSLASLGSPLYDLDGLADETIELDYDLNPGSGAGDMFAYIPMDLFDFQSNPYVYLYSAFGNPNDSNDGFEEWAIIKTDREPPIPAPGAAVLGMIGMCLVGRLKRSVA